MNTDKNHSHPEQTNPNARPKADFRIKHYIPDVNHSFGNFEDFFLKREELIFNKLKETLLE